MLIKLVDGGIKDIYTDTDSYAGCETCDYGSEYINEFTVYLTQGNIEFKISQMYEWAVSEDYLMKLFLQNVDAIKEMTEKQFFEWLKERLELDLKGEVEEFELKMSSI